jgi:hypothetical protein
MIGIAQNMRFRISIHIILSLWAFVRECCDIVYNWLYRVCVFADVRLVDLRRILLMDHDIDYTVRTWCLDARRY